MNRPMRIIPFPGVFRPLSDSRMLADAVASERLAPGSRTLDLCTGSGLIALTAARAGAEATAIDVSRRAVVAVRLNALVNGVRVRALRGDLFAPVADERFDVISANPPYVPAETDALPRRGAARALDAGSDGRAFIERICKEAPAHLRPGGSLLLVHSSVCGEQRTLDGLTAAGLQTAIVHRHRGPLGPVLQARLEMLRSRGLSDGSEDVIVFRAQRPVAPEHARALGGRTAAAN
jgi:release factor glutamine methyltransferase